MRVAETRCWDHWVVADQERQADRTVDTALSPVVKWRVSAFDHGRREPINKQCYRHLWHFAATLVTGPDAWFWAPGWTKLTRGWVLLLFEMLLWMTSRTTYKSYMLRQKITYRLSSLVWNGFDVNAFKNRTPEHWRLVPIYDYEFTCKEIWFTKFGY